MTDRRPQNCRFRLMDAGEPYGRSGCNGCGRSILKGLTRETCPHAKDASPPAAHSIEKDGVPARPIRIFLDGEEISDVIAYDTVAGWLQKYQTDAEGRITYDRIGDKIHSERLTGVVTVEWRDR